MDLAPVDFIGGLGGINALPNPAQEQATAIGLRQQLGALQTSQLQRDAMAQQVQQQAAAQQHQQQFQTDLATLGDNPNANGIASMVRKYPEFSKQLQDSHNIQDEAKRDSDFRTQAQIYSAAAGGNYDLAAQLLQSHHDAAVKAGEPEDPTDTAIITALKSSDPAEKKRALSMIGLSVASINPDKFNETYKTLNPVATDKNHFTPLGDGRVLDQASGAITGDARRKPEYREIKVVDPVTGQETTQFVDITAGGGGQASGGGAPSGSGGAPLSVRTNNPGAIRFDPANKWQGQVGNEGGFVKFDTPANGARAHQKLIANQIKNGYDTPLAWAQHYAPAADGNDPQAYAQTVARSLGIGVNDKIPLSAVPKLAAASAGVEAGGTPSPQGTPNAPGVVASYVTKPAGGAGSAAFGIPENLQGAAVIQALPPNIARQVQGLLDGRQQLSARQASSPYGQQLIAAANQADPNYDTVNYNARAGVRKSFTSGADAKNVTSLGTAINHMGELYDAFQKLNNGSIPALNWLGNHMTNGPLYNKGTVQAFNANVNAVADELETTFRGSSGTLAGTESWKDAFGAAASPEAFKEVLHKAYSLLQGRADELGEKYSRGMGTTRDGLDLLSPVAKRNAALLGALGPKASGETPASSNAQPVHVATRAQAMALPSGTRFIDPSGKMRVRP